MVLDTQINKFWESSVLTVSYLVHYCTLFQNATASITKCYSYIMTIGIKALLQNAIVITKCEVYYKICRHNG